MRELGFINEAHSTETVRRNLAAARHHVPVKIPLVLCGQSVAPTRRALCLEFINGVKVTDAARVTRWTTGESLVADISAAFAQQVFVDGIFNEATASRQSDGGAGERPRGAHRPWTDEARAAFDARRVRAAAHLGDRVRLGRTADGHLRDGAPCLHRGPHLDALLGHLLRLRELLFLRRGAQRSSSRRQRPRDLYATLARRRRRHVTS